MERGVAVTQDTTVHRDGLLGSGHTSVLVFSAGLYLAGKTVRRRWPSLMSDSWRPGLGLFDGGATQAAASSVVSRTWRRLTAWLIALRMNARSWANK